MAKKKRTTKRRSRSLSSGGTKKRTHRRRSSSKGILSDGGIGSDKTPVSWPQAIKRGFGSVSGGYIATHVNKLVPATWPKLVVMAGTFGIAVGAAKMGMPAFGGGFAGGMTALRFQNGLMGEDANYANKEALNEQPIYLNENNEPMVLEEGEDGTAGYRILSEEEVAELQDQGIFSDYEVVN